MPPDPEYLTDEELARFDKAFKQALAAYLHDSTKTLAFTFALKIESEGVLVDCRARIESLLWAAADVIEKAELTSEEPVRRIEHGRPEARP